MTKLETRFYEGGIAVAAAAFAFLMIGCGGGEGDGGNSGSADPGNTYVVGKVTGGGWVPGPKGGKANFGFNASNCEDPAHPVGQFNYNDMTYVKGGVKMNGSLLEVGVCDTAAGCVFNYTVKGQPGSFTCPMGGYLFHVDYRSTNPKVPGVGEAVACVVDNGEGVNGTGDVVNFVVTSGPFEAYSASGTAQGNIQSHTCDE